MTKYLNKVEYAHSWLFLLKIPTGGRWVRIGVRTDSSNSLDQQETREIEKQEKV